MEKITISSKTTKVFFKFEKEAQNFALLLSSEEPSLFPRPIYNYSKERKYKYNPFFILLNSSSNDVVGLIEDLLTF